ncbi:DUF934 domain-containing protein [Chelativorans sp. AA-79]|uniref:DUF934 domain-containing protein n=1 Tax=Chelativorans sp. AA-79 TaxID=3028735 RepID=UPI0023F69AC7|nr:DUF934 domain-containing protein [Chelativorans sp. AA-79]WEX09330.1 DUF934 domain-containing protein [Chelativorans sp. AA-79]
MSATEITAPAVRLWAVDGFQENRWERAEGAEALAGNGNLLLPFEAFLALDPAKREMAMPRLGVEVLPGEAIDPLVPFLDRLLLVALAFPAFNDGRSYSKAELLRSRHGYTGEVRAVGDVLIDQIPHMLRCGFSSFEVKNETTIHRLATGRRGGVPLHYQPSSAAPARAGKYSWRRAAQEG